MFVWCISLNGILVFLCYLWSVCSQEFVLQSDFSKVFNLDSVLSVDYWFNLDFINDFTKSIVIIEGRNNVTEMFEEFNRLNDFQTNLIKHLNSRHYLPLVLLKPSTMDNETEVRNGMKHLQKDIFIMVYDNLESLRWSLDNPLYIYINCNRAHFLFVITLTELPDFTCDSETASIFKSLKEITGKFFEILWEKLSIIEVIIFLPFLCGHEFLIKCESINTFNNNDNYENGVIVVTRDTFDPDSFQLIHDYKDFLGYPLKINVFPRVPTILKKIPQSFLDTYLRNDIKQTGDLGGLDGMLMGNLVKRLNFTAIIEGPTDKGEYGYLVNDTITGSLGDIVNRKMEISLNSRFLKLYYETGDQIEFTYPIHSDQFCLLAPKAQRVPQWMAIFLIFDVNVWLLILLCVVLSGVVWWFMKTKLPEDGRVRTNPSVYYYLDIGLLFISSPMTLPKVQKERMFIAMCLLFNLIVVGVFQVSCVLRLAVVLLFKMYKYYLSLGNMVVHA